MDPQQQQQQRQGGGALNTIGNVTLAGGGLGLGYHNIKNSMNLKDGMDDYEADKKRYDAIQKEHADFNALSEDKRTVANMGENLKNYYHENSITDPTKIGDVLEKDKTLGTLKKIHTGGALGALGIGAGLLGTFNTLTGGSH